MEVPDDVFDDQNAFKAFLAQVQGSDPRRDGEALIAFLRGWLDRHGSDASETPERKQDARRLISELTSGLESLYAQDLEVARLEDELEMLRERQEKQVEELRCQYRGMVFWRGRNDDDVRAAADWVRQEFAPEVAEHILDLDGLFDDDIPQE